MSLGEYNRKRKFSETPEPPGQKKLGQGPLRFVVQKHEATRLHYDFRIEFDGSFKSWAVPKGPSLNPLNQRLAVQVEDHPLEYGSFEGVIPRGNYGAGTVMIWDHGTFLERSSKTREESESALLNGLDRGHITVVLEGQKLRGEFALVRLRKGDDKAWLLIKKRDEFASNQDITTEDLSVQSGRSMKEIAEEAPGKGEIWVPKRGLVDSIPEKAKLTPARKRVAHPSLESVIGIVPDPVDEKMPRKIRPMLATFVRDSFDEPGWIFERLWGGQRAIAEIERGRVHLYSKQGLPFEKKYPEIVAELRKIPHSLVVDGEIVKNEGKAHYVVYDLLHENGRGLRGLPLVARKERLSKQMIFNEWILFGTHETEKGLDYYEKAIEAGYGGVVAKDGTSAYRPGTSRQWLAIKARHRAPVTEVAEEKKLAAQPEGPGPTLTNLDKIYWPREKITKGDLIEYYRQVAPWILSHLKDRPQSLNRHPEGIERESFFQKDVIGQLPRWVETKPIFSDSAEKTINYILCQNEWTLLYIANLGCIELNPWISRVGREEYPDYAIIDLDPDTNDFEEVIDVALETNRVLNEIGAMSFCKTSGSTGLHICIPCGAIFDYETVREFAEAVCAKVHAARPANTSLERNPAKRRGRIYLDFMQNRKGQTLAAPYCVRPRPGAPVSTPLSWTEVRPGLSPGQFNIFNILQRLREKGDLWKPLLTTSVNIAECRRQLAEG